MLVTHIQSVPRPLKGEKPLDQRLQLLLTADEVAAVDDWMFTNRVRTRSEAIRQLIAAGLDASPAADPEPAPKTKRTAGTRSG